MHSLKENGRRQGCWTAINLIALGLILGGALSASAEGGWKSEGWIGLEAQNETDLKEGNGEFDFWLLNAGLKSTTMLSDKIGLSLAGDYRLVAYNFDGGRLASTPWVTVHVFRLNPSLIYKLSDNWSLIGGTSLQIAAENGADVGDSITGGGTAGARYKFSDNLSMSFGIIVTSQIEDSVWVQPFVLVDWAISDKLALAMEGTNSRGGEIRLSYSIGTDWELGIGAGFRRERFRLDNKGDALYQDGVGEEESIVVNLRAAITITDDLTLVAYGGTTVDGEFKIQDKDGKSTLKSDYDSGGYGGMRMEFSF